MEIVLDARAKSFKEAFTQIYLTLVSVIQGVAVGYLATVIGSRGQAPSYSWILIGATLVLIIGIWHTNAIGIAISAWVPTLADSFIPFLIGAGEIFVIKSINESIQDWVLSVAILNAGFIAAYLNYCLHMKRDAAASKAVAGAVEAVWHRGTLAVLGMAVIWTALYFVSLALKGGGRQPFLLACAILLLMLGHFIAQARALHRLLDDYMAPQG